MIKRYSAHSVFPVFSKPVTKGVVETENSCIKRIIECNENLREMANMEFYNGIICPSLEPVFEGIETISLIGKISGMEHYEKFISSDPFVWMKTVSLTCKLPLEQLLHLFCSKVAEAMGRLESCGILFPGKSPGIIVIDNIDFDTMLLTKESLFKRLC